jgi:hypothetical protein
MLQSVPKACCERLFKMFHLFQTYVASVFDLYVAYVSHICCKSMFKMFRLFQSYIAVSVFMLQVTNVLSGCSICFTQILQVYVPNCFIYFKHMLHSSISCCKCFIFERYVQRVVGA